MVGRGDHHRIDVRLFVQHYPPVTVAFGVGEFPKGAGCQAVVHIAQGNDVVFADALGVGKAFAADADAGDVEFFAGRGLSIAQDVSRNQRKGGDGGGVFE